MDKFRLCIKGSTHEEWTQDNQVLAERELAYDMTNKELKIGDGVTPFLSLDVLAKVQEKEDNKEEDTETRAIQNNNIDELKKYIMDSTKSISLFNLNIAIIATLTIITIISICVAVNINMVAKTDIKYQNNAIEQLEEENSDLKDNLKEEKKAINKLQDTLEELQKNIEEEKPYTLPDNEDY